MGGIVSGVLGIGSAILGGNSQKKAAQTAATSANQGFDWLKSSPLASTFVNNGAEASNALSDIGGQGVAANGQMNALLGLGGDQAAAENAFANFRNNTGYKFQMQEGTNAITGNAASKGLLNSGATLKALTGYGQNLANNSFQTYFGNLANQASNGQNALNTVAGQGVQAGAAVGNVGTTAGATAAQANIAKGDASAAMYGGIASGIGNIFGMKTG